MALRNREGCRCYYDGQGNLQRGDPTCPGHGQLYDSGGLTSSTVEAERPEKEDGPAVDPAQRDLVDDLDQQHRHW